MFEEKNKQKKSNFIMEIGCEELPPLCAKDAVLQIQEITKKVLGDARVTFEKVTSLGTYRRIVILVEAVEQEQKAEQEEIWGPPQSKVFDEKGNPNQVFEGFLKRHKALKKDVQVKKTEKGDYLCIVKEKPVLKVIRILPSLCQDIIKLIQFPKTMRWKDTFTFVRPIRWITIFFDNKKIKIKTAGVISGDYTFGHRLFSNKKIKVINPGDYLKAMKKHKVLIDPEERRKIILNKLEAAAYLVGAEPKFEEDLLDEVVYLCENPEVFAGSYERNFLKLPAEVLLASMSKNQKTFALFKSSHQPIPFFAAVIENSHSKAGFIKKNYETILNAKLKDAEFFYAHDTKTNLEEKNKKLEKSVFHKDLGSMLEKAERLRELGEYAAEKLNLSEREKNLVRRCAWLCKADIATEMVKEFPSLQGIMGFYYAKKSGEPEQVAVGIKEHYLPRFASDSLPKTKIGAVTGFIDRLDTIISCFAIDIMPTGSLDPYALRRQGTGLVKIAFLFNMDLRMSEIISLNIKLLGKKIKKDPCLLQKETILFLKDRLRPFLVERINREDLVEAVLNSNFDNFAETDEKIKQLYSILNSKDFFNASKVVERTSNILKSCRQNFSDPNPLLFKEKLEKELFAVYKNNGGEISDLIRQRKYSSATKVYADVFYDILHIFFDKVLINVENEKIRENRLALMKAINKLYTGGIADIAGVNLV